WSRLVFGARISLAVGVSAVLVQGSIGTVLGMLAGYFGGAVDLAIMRLADLQLSIPPLILAIGVMAVLGPRATNLILLPGAAGRDFLSTAWWIATLPGLAIFLTVVGVNLLGDWLRDVLDPRASRETVSF